MKKHDDLIKDDPFFSQVENMVEKHGLDKAREMLGDDRFCGGRSDGSSEFRPERFNQLPFPY
jgi:hypothetical protein